MPFDLALERGALAHQLLRLLGIVPEVGVFGDARSAQRDVAGRHPSQRCLLSSPIDCLALSTIGLGFGTHDLNRASVEDCALER